MDEDEAEELARILREKERLRSARKAELVRYITKQSAHGARLVELQELLPGMSRSQIQVLLRELVRRGTVHVRGRTRAARWFPGPRIATD